MKLTDILDKDKARLLSELSADKTPEKAVKIIESEYDRLLYSYNEGEHSDRIRAEAANMLQAARTSAPLITVIGDAVLWERNKTGLMERDQSLLTPEDKKALKQIKKAERIEKRRVLKGKALRALAWIMLILGVAAVAILFIIGIREGIRIANTYIGPASPWMFIGSAIDLFISGLLFPLSRVSVSEPEKEMRPEFRVDPDKIYRQMRAVTLIIDQNLEKSARTEELDNKKLSEGNGAGSIGEPEIELYAGLLEAAYTGDGEVCMEKMTDLRLYLHRNGIETEDYSDEHKEHFEMMPSEESGTIRPALIKDGELIKKGLAAGG